MFLGSARSFELSPFNTDVTYITDGILSAMHSKYALYGMRSFSLIYA